MSRARFRGFAKLRRTLRRMEPELLTETRSAIGDGAERMKADMIAGAPRSGDRPTSPPSDIVSNIAIKKGRDGMTAVIGPGARFISISANPFDTSKRMSRRKGAAVWAFAKAYWYEFGTKGSPERNVPPQPARPFMQPAFDRNRDQTLAAARAGIRSALQAASRGPTEDDQPL